MDCKQRVFLVLTGVVSTIFLGGMFSPSWADVPTSCSAIESSVSTGALNRALLNIKECEQEVQARYKEKFSVLFPAEVDGYRVEERPSTKVLLSKEDRALSGFTLGHRSYTKPGLAEVHLTLEGGATQMMANFFCGSAFRIKAKQMSVAGYEASFKDRDKGGNTLIVCVKEGGVVINSKNGTEEQLKGFADALGKEFYQKVEAVALLP